MKHFILFTNIFLLSLTSSAQQSKNEQVQAPVIRFFEALSTLNVDSLKYYCTADFVLLEDGEIWNADSLAFNLEKSKSITDFKRINRLDFFDTRITGNTAWVNYRNEAEITRNGKRYSIKWLESAILLKDKKRWVITQLHSTFVKRTVLTP